MKNTKLSFPFLVSTLMLFFGSCSTEELDEISTEELTTTVSSNVAIGNDFLDYGLYWFDANNNSTKGFNEVNNTAINVSSSYYDSSKPTMIYFHGWQLGSSEDNFRREGFYFEDGDVNTVQFWKNKGWNVAIFYWNQFADEVEVKDAEAKIWSVNGPRNMRYRQSNGNYSTLQSPSTDVANLAANQIKIALNLNTSNNVRFAGHSLGAQLASRTAMIISNDVNKGDISTGLKVDRLELLDPFWSAGGKSYLNNSWTGENSRGHINTMINRDNLAVTWYNSCLLYTSDAADE